jgi:hypothetical protein
MGVFMRRAAGAGRQGKAKRQRGQAGRTAQREAEGEADVARMGRTFTRGTIR